MAHNRMRDVGVLAMLAVLILLVGILVWQQHNLEKQVIVQGQQIRTLGEATDRIASGGLLVQGGGGGGETPKNVLHPEVDNFLGPKQTRWPPKGAKIGGEIIRGWSSGDPKGMNPLIENAADLGELIEHYAAAALATRNEYTDPEQWYGDLATRVEITDDFKELTFYIRKGVLWHEVPNVDLDGKHAWLKGDHEVTAHDYVFTFDLMMNPQVENGFIKNYYKELESWKAHDDHTLIVRWKKKQYLNIGATIGMVAIPKFLFAHEEDGREIPKETIGLRFNQHWYNNKGYVGAGPYRMVAYEPGVKIRLVRNERYYGDKPAIKELVYPIYTDPNQTLLKLKAHELSSGALRPSQYREEIRKYEGKAKPKRSPFFDGSIQCEHIQRPVYRYIGWNADTPIFSDAKVRRAMTLAFNRQEIIDNVFVGLGEIANGPFLPTTGFLDPNVDPLKFDLDRAKKLLAEAGWEDTDGDGLLDKKPRPGDKKRSPFEFTLLVYGSSPEYTSLANIFKEDLLKIGVKMKIDSAEWSLMQKRMEEKRFDAFTGAWLMGWETDPFQIWHSSQADIPKGSNRVGFRSKEADQLIEKLRVTFDMAERTKMLRRVHRLVHDAQAYSFFMVPKSVYCWWKEVKDVQFAKVRPVVSTMPWWIDPSG